MIKLTEHSDEDKTKYFKKSVYFTEEQYLGFRRAIAQNIGGELLELFEDTIGGNDRTIEAAEMFSHELGGIRGMIEFVMNAPSIGFVNFASCINISNILSDVDDSSVPYVDQFKKFLRHCRDKIRGFNVAIVEGERIHKNGKPGKKSNK